MVYEAEADGMIGEILVAEGEVAELGTPSRSSRRPAAQRRLRPLVLPGRPPRRFQDRHRGTLATQATGHGTGSRARATQVARRTAVSLGVLLEGLEGTGPGGRIRRSDVLLRVGAPATAALTPRDPSAAGLKGETRVIDLSPTARTIARRMT